MLSALNFASSIKNPFQSASKTPQAPTVAPPAGGEPETAGAEGGGPPSAGGTNQPESTNLEEAASEQLFDELLTAPVYSYDQYQELLRQKEDVQGTTAMEKRYWGHPRRWKVIIWGIKLKNTLPDTTLQAAFVEFEIGGNREEVRVETGTKTNIFVLGQMKCRLQTGLAYGIKGGDRPSELQYRKCIEYWGSYSDLPHEHIRIRLWRCQKFNLNRVEGVTSEVLEQCPFGSIYRERALYKPVEGKRVLRSTISYNLYFQEIYDFELQFFQWRVFGYQTALELEYLLKLLGGSKLKQKHSNIRGPQATFSGFLIDNRASSLDISGDVKTLPIRAGTLEPRALTADEEKHMAQCIPRLTFSISSNTTYNKHLHLSSTTLKNNVRPYWENVGTLYFRGTIYELESAVLHVEVQDLFSSRHRVVAKGDVPLKGVVDYAYLQAKLRAPPWLTSATQMINKRGATQGWTFGSVEGKISIMNTPLHRQTGEMGAIDKARVNLFIQIDRVDPIVSMEERQDLSPFIQVAFDGDTQSTRVVKGSLAPVFDELLVFPLQLPSKDELTVWDIEQKGLIWIDVWSRGQVVNDHCGGTSLSLRDIFLNSKGQEYSTSDVRVVDSETGNHLRYNTRKTEFRKALNFTFPTDRTSYVTFAAWTMPDLFKHAGLHTLNAPTSMSLPMTLENRMDEYEQLFDLECVEQAAKLEPQTRFYYCYALNQRLVCQFLPALCGKLVPPKFVDNCSAVAQYVRCVQFAPPRRVSLTSNEDTALGRPGDAIKKTGLSRIWATPEFTLAGRSGSIPDHALLHVSLLTGLSAQAFVCVGSLWDHSHHIWVCTFHFHDNGDKSYGYVRFWETTNGQVYMLKNRFKNRQVIKEVFMRVQNASTEKPSRSEGTKRKGRRFFPAFHGKEKDKETDMDAGLNVEFALENEHEDPHGRPIVPSPKLPYRSLDMLFNHFNIWVNKQDPNPGKIWFDLWRENFWHQFTPENYDIKPCFVPRVVGRMANEAYVATTLIEIKERCRTAVTKFRASRNITTRWNNDIDLQEFLLKGLQLLHQAETARDEDIRLAELKRRDWKKALYAKVPLSCRLKGITIHFNRCDCATVADTLVRRCDFLESRARSATFALAGYMRVFPGHLSSLYIVIILVHRVPERERRKIREQQEKERREKAVRRVTRGQHMEANHSVDADDQHPVPLFAATLQEDEQDTEADLITADHQLSNQINISSRTSIEKSDEKKNKDPFESSPTSSQGDAITPRLSVAGQLSKSEKVTMSSMRTGDGTLHAKKSDEGEKTLLSKNKSTRATRKSLKVSVPPGAVTVTLQLKKKEFSAPWNDPVLFRTMLRIVDRSLAEGLRVPSKRIKAFRCDYRDGSIELAIQPPTARSQESPEDLADELAMSITDIIQQSPKLWDITNGEATIERDSNKKPPLSEKKSKKAPPVGKGALHVEQLDSFSNSASRKSKKKPKFPNKEEKTLKLKKRRSKSGKVPPTSASKQAEVSQSGDKNGPSAALSSPRDSVAAVPVPVTSLSHSESSTSGDGDSQREEAARSQFYDEMRAADPHLFNELKNYYELKGHSQEHALYFAAYYTAMKVYQTPCEAVKP